MMNAFLRESNNSLGKHLFILPLALIFICLTTKANIVTEGINNDLLQFTVGEHVIAFQPECLYLTGSDHMLNVTFHNANVTTPEVEYYQPLESRTQPLEKVIYHELWKGIDLTFERKGGGIVKSTYIVSPGSDPGQINLSYNVPVRMDKAGNLVFEFKTGKLSETSPVAWQIINGDRFAVDVEFYLPESKKVSFEVGEYDPLHSLIIDPEWEWNTFLGGSDRDEGKSIAVDGSGNIYIAGYSDATWGAPVNAHTGANDAFVAKLNSSGVLQWNTFLGGSNTDYGESVTVDDSGNVYIAGRSYQTWGTPVNPFAGAFGYDAFAAKLNNSGVLQWHTFMGASIKEEYCRGIVVDGSNNVYVVGSSAETWGLPVNEHAGGDFDAFAVKLNESGELQWNTFMGSSSDDGGKSIAVDGNGNVYIAGNSGATWASPVIAHAGGFWDAFVAKLNNSGVLQWNTFMGSSGDDYGESIAVNGSGNIYAAGYSSATWGSPVTAHEGWNDAFSAKLNNSGVLQWNTFMGSSGRDSGESIAVDVNGNVYIVGISIYSTWGSPVNPLEGNDEAFAAKLNSSGALQWNTFMGSSDFDEGYGIVVDSKGKVYVVGNSDATWGSPVIAHSGGFWDAFVVKFDYSDITNVETDLGLPTAFKLSQNYPNPFSDLTLIKYALPGADQVTLKVYNIHGEKVKTLVDQFQTQGNYEIVFDATQLSGGIYLYELNIGNSILEIKKMTLIK
jgi:hypothetical protein